MHQQTAAYVALGAAPVTGKPQAFAVVPEPSCAVIRPLRLS
jgi:acetolactate synthase-1/2/3 large subunit